MIWVLRHIGVQLWISCLIAVPVSFYLLSTVNLVFSGVNPFVVGSVIFLFTAALVGFLMDLAARKRLDALIKEAQTWERSGIFQKAEKKYIQALRLYDTFLLWPFSTKKTAVKLSKAIAGLQLSSGSIHPNLKLGTAVYLRMNPQDRDMALLYVNQAAGASILTTMDQEVLTILAQTYSDDKIVSAGVKEIFQSLQRNDYVAQRLYDDGTESVCQRLEDGESVEGPTRLGDLRQEPLLRPLEQDFPHAEPVKKSFELQRLLSVVKLVYSAVVNTASSGVAYLREHERVRFYIKTGLVFIICGGLAFFMISTLVHNLKTKAAEQRRIAVEAAIPKPFTIQVAAYLKMDHAQRYAAILKKEQIDAVIEKVDGGGKTWFVVRVSKFEDKKSAADYGRLLRQKGIIEDFFVSNR